MVDVAMEMHPIGEAGIGGAIRLPLDSVRVLDAITALFPEKAWKQVSSSWMPTYCMESRPGGGLAGGCLTLALMHNAVTGCDDFIAAVYELSSLGFELHLHDDCVALREWRSALQLMVDPDAPLYRLYDRLHPVFPLDVASRQALATWARHMPSDYVPLDFSPLEEEHCIEGLYCDQTTRAPLVGMVLYNQLPRIFVAHDWLGKAIGGQPPIINEWMAGMNAIRMTDVQSKARHAALVARLFGLAVVASAQLSSDDFVLNIDRIDRLASV